MLKASGSASRFRRSRRGFDPPDLHTQLESLLHQVWRCEADWRLYDRIDAFCASEPDRCGSDAAPQSRGSKR